MDAATIQKKINAGYGKAAARVGFAFQQWRPTSSANPTTAGNNIGALNASFTVKGATFNFTQPAAYKDVLFNGLFDASQTQVGDYLVGANDTYFIAQQQDLLPPLCVRCNRIVSVWAPGPSKVFGADSNYGGTTPASESAVMTAWPASIMFDARGRVTEVGLPTDLPSPFFQILLPAWGAVDVRSSRFVSDDLGRRYTIAAAERSPLGWRLSAQQAVT